MVSHNLSPVKRGWMETADGNKDEQRTHNKNDIQEKYGRHQLLSSKLKHFDGIKNNFFCLGQQISSTITFFRAFLNLH